MIQSIIKGGAFDMSFGVWCTFKCLMCKSSWNQSIWWHSKSKAAQATTLVKGCNFSALPLPSANCASPPPSPSPSHHPCLPCLLSPLVAVVEIHFSDILTHIHTYLIDSKPWHRCLLLIVHLKDTGMRIPQRWLLWETIFSPPLHCPQMAPKSFGSDQCQLHLGPSIQLDW